MTYKNKWFLLIAFERFHLLKEKGACKSIDVKIIDEAVKKNITIVIYIHEPTFEHEPECYYISPDKIKNWGWNCAGDVHLKKRINTAILKIQSFF